MKKLKLMTIVGTRPEIIKMSAIIKKADKYFEPKMSKDEREARLDKWNRAVERCKNWATSDKGDQL